MVCYKLPKKVYSVYLRQTLLSHVETVTGYKSSFFGLQYSKLFGALGLVMPPVSTLYIRFKFKRVLQVTAGGPQ